MILASRLLGLEPEAANGDKDVLGKMDVGKQLIGVGEEGGNVWKLVMGDDMLEGDGEVKETA
jgi:hypothetical protein